MTNELMAKAHVASQDRLDRKAQEAKTWRALLRPELKNADLSVREQRARELWAATAGKPSQKNALPLAVKAGMVDLLAPLMALGAMPNVASTNGEIPLHCAMGLKSEAEQRATIDALLAAGAQMESWLHQPFTAAMVALSFGSIHGLKTLAKRGAILNPAPGQTQQRERWIDLPRWGAEDDLARALPTWVALGGDINMSDSWGNTMLTRALQANRLTVARAALACGAKTNRDPSRLGPAPLELAAQTGVEGVAALLDAGADPNETLHDGGALLANELESAFLCPDYRRAHQEEQRGSAARMCALLLRHGARLDAPAPLRHGDNVTVLQLARRLQPQGSAGREVLALIEAWQQAKEIGAATDNPAPARRAPRI